MCGLPYVLQCELMLSMSDGFQVCKVGSLGVDDCRREMGGGGAGDDEFKALKMVATFLPRQSGLWVGRGRMGVGVGRRGMCKFLI